MLRAEKDRGELKSGARRVLLTAVGLLCALLADAVLAPALLLGWTGFRFLPAFVVLLGMFRGRWNGLWGGWLGGVLAASLFTEPLGFAMLRLGLVGFAGGFFSKIATFGAPGVDGLVLLVLLLVEDLLGGLVAWVVLGVSPDLNLLGILATAAVVTAMLRVLFRLRRILGLTPETAAT